MMSKFRLKDAPRRRRSTSAPISMKPQPAWRCPAVQEHDLQASYSRPEMPADRPAEIALPDVEDEARHSRRRAPPRIRACRPRDGRNGRPRPGMRRRIDRARSRAADREIGPAIRAERDAVRVGLPIGSTTYMRSSAGPGPIVPAGDESQTVSGSAGLVDRYGGCGKQPEAGSAWPHWIEIPRHDNGSSFRMISRLPGRSDASCCAPGFLCRQYSHSRRSARSKSARSAKPSSRAAASMSSGNG